MIKPLPNSLIVNLGATFSKCLDHKLKATMHRVVDLGGERLSCPFFFEPKFYGKIPRSMFNEKEK